MTLLYPYPCYDEMCKVVDWDVRHKSKQTSGMHA